MKIFFTSDLHLGHDKSFIFGPRGFSSIEEHDETIINNWNQVVGADDIVYILGDVIMGDQEKGIEKLKRLNGKEIVVIVGNHDTEQKMSKYLSLDKVYILGYADIIKYGKYRFYLSHHPTITSNMEKGEPMHRHLINLFGHTHSKDKFFYDMPFMYNVACDAHNCTPVSVEQIIQDIKDKVEECKMYL